MYCGCQSSSSLHENTLCIHRPKWTEMNLIVFILLSVCIQCRPPDHHRARAQFRTPRSPTRISSPARRISPKTRKSGSVINNQAGPKIVMAREPESLRNAVTKISPIAVQQRRLHPTIPWLYTNEAEENPGGSKESLVDVGVAEKGIILSVRSVHFRSQSYQDRHCCQQHGGSCPYRETACR